MPTTRRGTTPFTPAQDFKAGYHLATSGGWVGKTRSLDAILASAARFDTVDHWDAGHLAGCVALACAVSLENLCAGSS